MDYPLEDSLDRGPNNPLSQSLRYSLSQPECEVGGAFYFNESLSDYFFLKIKSKNLIEKDFFSCSNYEFYKLFNEDRIISLFHTHTKTDSSLSDFDLEVSKSFNLPSCVFSLRTKEFNLYYPTAFKPRPLNKRIFIPMFQDCVTFMKDFYLNNMDINLHKVINNWARSRNKSNEILINKLNENFIEIDKSELEYGDILVLRPEISKYLHLAIYIENNEVFHHPMHMLPKKEFINPEQLNKVYKVYRYKEL